MQRWTLFALSGLLASCQLLDPASLDGLFAGTDPSDTPTGAQGGLVDSADPDTGTTACGDTGGAIDDDACGADGGGTGTIDSGATDGGDTGAPEPMPCSEDLSLRLTGGRGTARLDFTDARLGQPDGQARRSAVQVPSGAAGTSGAWEIGHGPDFLIGVQLPPGTALSVRLEPQGSPADGTPEHLVAFLEGCPADPDLCNTDDPMARSGDCISEIADGSWWSGVDEGWQASLENPSEDELYLTLLVDTTSPLEFLRGNLVYDLTEL